MLINLHGSHHKFDKFTKFLIIIKITTVAESKYVKEQNYYKSSSRTLCICEQKSGKYLVKSARKQSQSGGFVPMCKREIYKQYVGDTKATLFCSQSVTTHRYMVLDNIAG